MSFLIMYAYPSLLALLLIAWLFLKTAVIEKTKLNGPLILFLIGIVGLNVIEFTSYTSIIEAGLSSLKAYYFLAGITLAAILFLSLKSSNVLNKPKVYLALSAITAMVCLTELFTDLMIVGYSSIGYSITKISGEYFWVVQAYGLLTILLSITCLVIGAKNKAEKDISRKCSALLISFIPFLGTIFILIVLMQFGIKINGSLIIPIITTYMFMLFLYLEHKNNIFKILLFTPYTEERKYNQRLRSDIESFIFTTSNGEPSCLKALTTSIEKNIVTMAVELSNGSQVEAASLLKVSTSSVCRKK